METLCIKRKNKSAGQTPTGSGLFSSCRVGADGVGSQTVCLHALRHGVAEGLLEAAGERSGALDGERAHGAAADCQRVNMLLSSPFQNDSTRLSLLPRSGSPSSRCLSSRLFTPQIRHVSSCFKNAPCSDSGLLSGRMLWEGSWGTWCSPTERPALSSLIKCSYYSTSTR